jgi:hypothetical protein
MGEEGEGGRDEDYDKRSVYMRKEAITLMVCDVHTRLPPITWWCASA